MERFKSYQLGSSPGGAGDWATEWQASHTERWSRLTLAASLLGLALLAHARLGRSVPSD